MAAPAASRRLSADLLSLGTQCSLPECQQTDFLPFSCDACNSVFCLEHRTYRAHSCAKAGDKDTQIIVCPLCARGVRLHGQEDPNLAFERHAQQDCDPDNYAKVHKKKRCPVEGCKEKLNSTNTFACKSCHSEVCLKHRFPTDHQCKDRAAAGAAKQHPSKTSALLTLSRAVLPKKQDVRANVFTAGLAGKQKQQQAGSLEQAPPQAGSEICPRCSARFSNVTDLIQHVDFAHAGGPFTSASEELERCPHCSGLFPDAVSLVQHVEQQHSNKSACVLC